MRTLLLGDIGNRLDIEDAENEIRSLKAVQSTASARLRTRETEIANLKAELGRQALAVQALTRFLVAKGIIGQDELNDFIREVDGEDGVVDGRMTLEPTSGRLRFPAASPHGGIPTAKRAKPEERRENVPAAVGDGQKLR